MSGVALQVERQLLHARLQEKANNIALAEEQIWDIWADWQGLVWEGQVDYPHGYDVRDTIAELQSLKLAREIQPVGEEVNKEIDRRVAELVVSDPDRLEMVLDKMDAPVDPDGPAQGKMGEDEMEHPTLTQETWREHTRGMLDEGYTLAEIEALHPELTQLMLEDNVNRNTE